VFALLACLCFPVFALAEDSSEIEYRDAPPSVPGKKSDGSSASSSGDGGGVGAPGKSSTTPGDSGGGSSQDGSSADKSGGAAGGKDGGGGPGGAAKDPAGKAGLGPGQAIGPEGAPISHESSSSPLVPILIALAILAAISIGFVALKRRRQGSDRGSAVSPEAG